MATNRGNLERRFWARIRAILDQELPIKISQYNSGVPEGAQIPKRINVVAGFNQITLENSNSIDTYPTICVFQQSSRIERDVGFTQTEVKTLGINASIIYDGARTEWASTIASSLNQMAAQILEENGATFVCEFDVYLWEFSGGSNSQTLVFPNSTKLAVSVQSSMTAYMRYDYDLAKKDFNEELWELPFTRNEPNFPISINDEPEIKCFDFSEITKDSIVANSDLLEITIENNSEGTNPPSSGVLYIINQGKWKEEINWTTNAEGTIDTSDPTTEVIVGDLITITFINSKRVPHVYTIKIT